MASTRKALLADNVIGGVESTLPAHLVPSNKWRGQHNMRNTPSLEQVPLKHLHSTVGSKDVRNLAMIPGSIPGYARVLVFTEDEVRTLSGTLLKGSLVRDTNFRRWATTLYNGSLYYTNELNTLRRNDGAVDVAVANAPAGRYVVSWYDHIVVGYPTFKNSVFPHRVMWSDLYNFSKWDSDKTNEADHYDMVEWQMPDYPFVGVTGLGKLRGTCYVYTPTAIIPMRYVGLPKIIQVDEDGIITRNGNTFPWTLAVLDNVHFYYDGIERSFFAFDGQQVLPIGEPIRAYLRENLNEDVTLAAKMWASIDVDNREVWWRFVSKNSTGVFDKAVVFNYRYRQWFTASDENIHAFCGTTFRNKTAGELFGTAGSLTGTAGMLGATGTQTPRLYGSTGGNIYRDEVSTDADADLLPQEDVVLESGDNIYGNLSYWKEVDACTVNAKADRPLEVRISARDYLDDAVDWTEPKTFAGLWTRSQPNGKLSFKAKPGRVVRYRFKQSGGRGLKFSAYEPLITFFEAEA